MPRERIQGPERCSWRGCSDSGIPEKGEKPWCEEHLDRGAEWHRHRTQWELELATLREVAASAAEEAWSVDHPRPANPWDE